MSSKIIIGPPGTGKTTELLRILDKELERTDPDQIAFVSFTRKGAYEARDRAVDRFRFTPNELPYFRTLHSLAYRAYESPQILVKRHYLELGNLLGLRFSGYFDVEEIPGTVDSGDRMLFLDQFARNTCSSLRDVWHDYGENINWFRLKNVRDTFNEYKKKKDLLDFTDLIENFIKVGSALPVKTAIIDEAQDLSTLQWKMVNVAFKDAKRIYIAGDDDQALYKWSGADVEHFLNLKGKITFLKKSHRIPKEVFDLSQEIVQKIKNRHKKKFSPIDREGSVKYYTHPSFLEFNQEDWLLLARNRYFLKEYEKEVRFQGYIYSTRSGSVVDEDHSDAIYAWEKLRKGGSINESLGNKIRELMGFKQKYFGRLVTIKDFHTNEPWFYALSAIPRTLREYYRTILRKGGNLRNKPNIHIDSIHGVKGGEATNVVLMLDMANKTYQNYLRGDDDEHRVFYVGATRAKKNLHIVLPQTEMGYLI